MNTHSHLASWTRFAYPALIFLFSTTLLLGLFPATHHWGTWLTPPVALFAGLAYALLCGPTHRRWNRIGSKVLLQCSVVALGFGMNVHESLASGQQGMLFTIASVAGTLLLGWLLGRKLLKVDARTSTLIGAGTAICGGSAIAAVGPAIEAEEHEMSVALGVVFLLNALALFLFPAVGHLLHLDQQQFGTWAAIAIHDTSSVVGAGAAYGEEALRVATTIKLTRALWIVPVVLLYSSLHKARGVRRIAVPGFILFFIGAILLNTYLLEPHIPAVGHWLSAIGRKGLTLSLFFIGASLTPDVVRKVGARALMQGILLWLLISLASLAWVML